jgi:hypothetical protein
MSVYVPDVCPIPRLRLAAARLPADLGRLSPAPAKSAPESVGVEDSSEVLVSFACLDAVGSCLALPPRHGSGGVAEVCGVEVVVASGFLAWVDVRGRDEPGDAGAELDGPLFFVDQVVVV